MPADDQVLPIDQIERLESRERGNESGVADQALFESRQAGQRGRSNASLRAD